MPSRIVPSGKTSFFPDTPLYNEDPAVTPGEPPVKATPSYIPPWTKPYIIGIAGTSGSGKTSVASKIIEELNTPWTVLLSMDNFYKPLDPVTSKKAFANEYDFDLPNAVDLEMCYECVRSLKEGRQTRIPVYSFAAHDRMPGKEITIYGASVIIVEGIYALYHPGLLSLMDLKIYVDTDLDICLARRLLRDIVFRGRDLKGALKQWNLFVKPNAERFIRPTMQAADLVLPRGADNYIAIDMMIRHVQKQLELKLREHMAELGRLREKGNLDPKHIIALPKTNQMNVMHTTLLSRDTLRDDFVFYFNRVAAILVSKALECAAYVPCSSPVFSELGQIEHAVELAEEVVAVNIIRSGDCFMHLLRQTSPEMRIGKLLIQLDRSTGEPQLHLMMLPPLNSTQMVLLMDAQIISGAAVIMLVQVLLDHGVSMENVVVVCYLAAEQGLRRVLGAFPGIRIVVGRIGGQKEEDGESEEDWWFRTRFIDSLYYGT